MAARAPEALEVDRLSVSYGKFVAVESATFAVAPGECVAVIGPNGHGKSSMVTAIAGLVRRGGDVRVFGERLPACAPRAAVRAGLVLVPERRHLYADLTVRDNIMLGGYSRTRRISARRAWHDASAVIDMFPELTRLLEQKAGTLSGGQQQMVALARAMAARPRILLLDEPCLGLAEAVAGRVYDWLGQLTGTDMTILLVEENPVQALVVADRSVRMYNGLTQEVATPVGEGA
ncbi:MAG TPA: ATP-binding cassette domain-containing protein [Trebonia sp.]|nr:ATP-binding cassette domain-containing protein [Trebonia sp.]